jgi:hypothetical protein
LSFRISVEREKRKSRVVLEFKKLRKLLALQVAREKEEMRSALRFIQPTRERDLPVR